MQKLLPRVALWLDDLATIHGSRVALEAVDESFPRPVPFLRTAGQEDGQCFAIRKPLVIVKEDMRSADL